MPVYLFAAYVVFWVVTFGLVLALWVRQRRLEREIAALQTMRQEQQSCRH
jgi:CcmD family protein